MPAGTTAAVIAANNSAATMAAIQAAEAAENARCSVVMVNYQPGGATQEAMRDYAHCVLKIYPDPATPGMIFVIKILITFVLIGMVAGPVVGRMKSEYRLDGFEIMMYGVGGMFGGGFVWLVLLAIAALFS